MGTINFFTVSVVEAVIIFILFLLIIFRKIGRPLSEVEVQERIKRRKQKDVQREERQYQRQLEWEQKLEKISAQEEEIKSMPTPVTFVSLVGDYEHGRTLCVQDGNNSIHSFHCDDGNLKIAPFFNGLYQSSIEPNYYSKRGAVLLK